MLPTAFIAITGLFIGKYLPKDKWLITSVVFGAMLPDIEWIFISIASLLTSSSLSIFHRTLTHSLFFPIILYLVIAIISELRKLPYIKIIGRGIVIGVLLHILFDIFLWILPVSFFWPLPIKLKQFWFIETIEVWIDYLMLSLNFLFFRIYAWILIQRAVENHSINIWFVKPLSIWMNIEFWLFILFILLTYFQVQYFYSFFSIAYVPSLLFALFSTFYMNDAIDIEE